MTHADQRIDWHTAFFQALQAELEDYAELLEFYSEFPLTNAPLRIDVLIIKKVPGVVIEKNIARIFRGTNIVEYKSPEDSLSPWDFEKVYGYACQYSATEKAPMTDMTVTFAATRHPGKLLQKLRDERGYRLEEREPGITLVHGDVMAIQVIETKKLSSAENLWLQSLRTDLDANGMVSVADARSKLKAAIGAYLNALFYANLESLKEMDEMKKQTVSQVLQEIGWTDEWIAQGEARGKTKGIKIGEARGAFKTIELLKSGMSPDDILRMYESRLEPALR
jgi:hypothetical protein